MKKRILSFLMACFMVASTFIISKPLVHVHAVEGDEVTYTEGENQWTLPMDWNTTGTFDKNNWELAIQGQWQLTTLTNPADNSTMRDDESKVAIAAGKGGYSPLSYIESRHNRAIVTPIDASKWTEWKVYLTTRFDGNFSPFKFGDNKTYINVAPTIALKVTTDPVHPAVVFTAPEDGTYSYSELVTGVAFEYASKAYSASATVRKNGKVINMFTPSATDTTRTLEGTVTLKKGELLTFVFTQNTDLKLATSEVPPIQLGKTVVTKIGEYAEESALEGTTYYLPMSWYDGLEKTEDGWELPVKGNWKVLSYSNPADITTAYEAATNKTIAEIQANKLAGNTGPIPYIESRGNRGDVYGVGDAKTFTGWYISAARRWEGGNIGVGDNVSFMKVSPGGGADGQKWTSPSDKNPTFVFTAPEDGLYSYSSFIIGDKFIDANGNAIKGEVTIRKNGKILDSFVPTQADAERTLTGTVSLKKGDLFMISFRVISATAVVAYDPIFVIGETYLNVIGDYVEEPVIATTTTTWELPDDFASLQNSYFKLKALNPNTGEYVDLAWTDTFKKYGGVLTDWAAVVGGVGVFYYYDNAFTFTGEASYLPVVEFTAPVDGTYSFSSNAFKYYGGVRKEIYSLVKGNEFELFDIPGLSISGVSGKNTLHAERATVDNQNVYLFATVELKAGETVSFVRSFAPDCTNSGASANTLKYFKVTSTDVTCPHDFTSSNGACACGAACKHAWENGVCTICSAKCEHDWSNVDGVCAICGLGCTHDWSNKDGVCANCGIKCNHNIDFESNYDGTHKCFCADCNKVFNEAEECEPTEGNFCACGHDLTTKILAENVSNMIKDYITNGKLTGEYIEAVGPEALGDEYKVTQTAPVDGAAYVQFNVVFDAEGNVYLRHHFYITGDVTITLNGEAVVLKNDGCSEGVFYFDELMDHSYDNASEIGIGNETIEVSLYSYIKIALGKVSADQETILRALYDFNEAMSAIK